MKFTLSLIILLFLSSITSSQDLRKLIDQLDTAYYHDDYKTAKQLVDKIYPSVNTIKDDTVAIEFLNIAGSLYYSTGEYTKAKKYISEAADKASATLGENEYHYALAIFNLASCYKEEGRYVEAEPLYLKSLPVLAPAMGQSSVQYTRCFYTLAVMYIDMGKYNEAEGMCAAAVNFYKQILGDTSADYLASLAAIAIVYQGQGKYDKAEEILLSLKTYYEAQTNPSRRTLQTIENNLGELYRHMSYYEKAESHLLKSVALAGDTTEEAASAFNNLALVQKSRGNYSAAEQSYKKAIVIYINLKKTEHPDYTNPVNNLGELYRTMGRFQEAMYTFIEVIELRKKTLGTNHPNYANAVNNLALVESYLGLYDDAEKHLLECRDIYKRTVGDKDKLYANSLNNLAALYNMQGKLKLAEENFKECLRIFKETYGETSDKYGVYIGGLAATYRLMKSYDEAIRLTLQSMSILKNKLGENHYDYIETEYHLAETYREAKKYKEAEQHYLQSMKGYLLLIEKYFPALSENDKTSFYYNVAAAFETFNSFVIQMQTEFPAVNHDALLARMYNNQVALKSLLLKESERVRTQVYASNDAKLKGEYEQWLHMRETIIQQYRMSPEDVAAAGINIAEVELQANELEQHIAIALKMDVKNIDKNTDWKDIQAALKPGEYAIEIIRVEYYTKGRYTDTVYYAAMVIDKTCTVPKLIMLNNGNTLETKSLSAYRRALKSKITDDFSYDIFWTPLKKALVKPTRVYFSADGVYQQVNMNTLHSAESRQYLMDEVEFTLVTNTRDILSHRAPVNSKTAEIFSFPDYGVKSGGEASTRYMPGFPDLKELPGTKIEADSIKQLMIDKTWKVNLHLQKDATEGSIKKVRSPQVLHIATHGFFLNNVNNDTGYVMGIQSSHAKQNPLLRSGVILAGAAAFARDSTAATGQDDGILTAFEAMGLNLAQTDLVVLSACETGLGEQLLNGQGVYGLQRAFLVAGASAVIMSLWVVDDIATQDLMRYFYREWLDHPDRSKQASFRAAQMKLKEKYGNPYYWGAFVMVGE